MIEPIMTHDNTWSEMRYNVCGMKSCRLRAISCQVTQKLKRLPAGKGRGYNP